MRIFMTAAILAAMATTALGQDPNRNRMNDQFPEVGQQEKVARPAAQATELSPYENRMNVRFQESTSVELTGGPNPYGNRMNFEWPKAQPKAEPKAQPKEVERTRIDP